MDFMKIIGAVAGGSAGGSLNNLKNLLMAQTNQAAGQSGQSSGSVTDSALAEMSLLFHALYGALLDKGVITQADFQKKFDELDMMDGIKNGR